MRPDIVPGGSFPDYELRDHSGTKRRLSELQGADPMVLVLSRGSFCPKDREQHRLLAAMEPEYWGRPSPEQLRADLRAVTEKV
jgi:peroxiredoxin